MLTLVYAQSTWWTREIWSVSNRVFFFRTPRTPPPQRKRASPSPLGRPVDSKNGRKSIPTRSSWPSTRPLNKSRPRREYGRLWALLQADISAQSMCWAALGWPSDTPCLEFSQIRPSVARQRGRFWRSKRPKIGHRLGLTWQFSSGLGRHIGPSGRF